MQLADFDYHLTRLVLRLEEHTASRAFAAGCAIVRHLDAMIHGVANHMHERIGQLFDDGAIQFDLVTLGFHPHWLAELPRKVTDQPRHPAEQRTDRDQPHRHGGFLQFGRDAGHLCQLAL